MEGERQYLLMLREILEKGLPKTNRTGTTALTIPGYMLQQDLRMGFPLLTTKKMSLNNVAIELEFFINGLTSKKWLKYRGCHIWDNWCNPQKVTYGRDEETKKKMREEDDLGKIYGYQWRNFNDSGIDQLANALETLKKDFHNRQQVVSAWNPQQLDEMALPPCHLGFHFVGIGNTLHLTWYQRSCDGPLGIPYNFASYALLLLLCSRHLGKTPGIVTGFLSDVHIYENQIDGVKEQLTRYSYESPVVTIPERTDFKDFNVFNWEHSNLLVTGYSSHAPIRFPIAV